MIKLYMAASIKDAERAVFSNGASENQLICRAGYQLFCHIKGQFDRSHSIAVFCGGGNNGADGLEFAINAAGVGYAVKVFMVGKKFNSEVQSRLEKLSSLGIEPAKFAYASEAINADIIIDAIFGTGLTRDIDGLAYDVISKINASEAEVVSVDIPSGLNSDTGNPVNICVKASQTVSFIARKLGHYLGQARNYVGELSVYDIGVSAGEGEASLLSGDDCILEKREIVSHKGNYGRVHIIAGSKLMVGSSMLAHSSALASLRGGAGYAVLCVPEGLVSAYQARVMEEMLYTLSGKDSAVYDKKQIDEIASSGSAVVVGMGMGSSEEIIKIITHLLKMDINLVIDADGLNALAKNMNVLSGHKARVVLTPHVGEFNRLLGQEWDGRVDSVKNFAKVHNVVVVVKSATSIISDGERVAVNITGTPAMAKAGSGDVLAGLMGGLLASSDEIFERACMACYYFGKAGQKAEQKSSEHSMLASDIVGEIKVFSN